MTIDLEKLNSRELTSLMKAAQKRKALLEKRPPVAAVRRKVLALLKASGYSIEELVGDGKIAAAPAPAKSVKRVKRTKLGKAPVKYRDPDNKRNTWSGRGSTPRWLLEKTARGRSVADYLIPGLAKPTARKAAPIGKRTVFKQA